MERGRSLPGPAARVGTGIAPEHRHCRRRRRSSRRPRGPDRTGHRAGDARDDPGARAAGWFADGGRPQSGELAGRRRGRVLDGGAPRPDGCGTGQRAGGGAVAFGYGEPATPGSFVARTGAHPFGVRRPASRRRDTAVGRRSHGAAAPRSPPVPGPARANPKAGRGGTWSGGRACGWTGARHAPGRTFAADEDRGDYRTGE